MKSDRTQGWRSARSGTRPPVKGKALRAWSIVGFTVLAAALSLFHGSLGASSRASARGLTSASNAPAPTSEYPPANQVAAMGRQPEPNSPAHSSPSRQLLENYKAYAIYPPTSRPVTPERAKAFKYNHRTPEALPIFARDKTNSPSFYAVFTADKVSVFEKESVSLTLKATATRDPNAPGIPISLTTAGLAKGRNAHAPTVADLHFRDDGREGDQVAGDLTYTALVDPSNLPSLAKHQGSVKAFVDFSANGASGAEQLFFEYFPAAAIAGRFTGRIREVIEDGSLVIYAGIDVSHPGQYSIDATLQSSDGRAICHSRFKGALGMGIREARLLFFGKAILDASPPAQSPFKIVEMYGQVVPEPSELLELAKGGAFAPPAVPMYEGSYVTSNYGLRTFSSSDWNAPEKQERLKLYGEIAAER